MKKNIWKHEFHFEDSYYFYQGYNHDRYIVRAVLLNEENKVALLHVVGDDIFGHRDCYELPGGGKKYHESYRHEVKREILEETGYTSKVIAKLGKVVDFYNLICRKNHNFYFICKTKKYVGQHLEEYEKGMIKECIFVDIDTAIRLMKDVDDDGVGHLVAQREIPILKLAKEFIKKNEHIINQ